MSEQRLGPLGEQVAASYLERAGYVVLDRNWRDRTCEIDIVARDGDTLVFVEVKTRRSKRHGSPAEAVTGRKLEQMRRGAVAWLARHRVSCGGIRLDVVSVVVPASGVPDVSHLRGVGQ
jgi:putative endonuclease